MKICSHQIGVQLLFIVIFETSPVKLQGLIEKVTCINVEAPAGEVANLTCLYYPPDVQLDAVTWRHNTPSHSKEVFRYEVSSGNKQPSRELEGRSKYFHLVGNTTLSILNITEKEDGTYECEIEAQSNRLIEHLQLLSYYNANGSVDFGSSEIMKIVKRAPVTINVTANCTKPAVEIVWSDQQNANNVSTRCENKYAESIFSTYFRNGVTSAFNVTAVARHPSFADRHRQRTYHVFVEDISVTSRDPENCIIGLETKLDCLFLPKDAKIHSIAWYYRNYSKNDEAKLVYSAEVGKNGTAAEHLYGRANYSMEPQGTASLLIQDLVETDEGLYICQLMALGQYESSINLTTQSNFNTCIEWDSRTSEKITKGNTVTRIINSHCCKPAVNFTWQFPEFANEVYRCNCSQNRFSTKTLFVRENVTEPFEVTVTARHNSVVLRRTYKVMIRDETYVLTIVLGILVIILFLALVTTAAFKVKFALCGKAKDLENSTKGSKGKDDSHKAQDEGEAWKIITYYIEAVSQIKKSSEQGETLRQNIASDTGKAWNEFKAKRANTGNPLPVQLDIIYRLVIDPNGLDSLLEEPTERVESGDETDRTAPQGQNIDVCTL